MLFPQHKKYCSISVPANLSFAIAKSLIGMDDLVDGSETQDINFIGIGRKHIGQSSLEEGFQ
jgi:hypothetical protein